MFITEDTKQTRLSLSFYISTLREMTFLKPQPEKSTCCWISQTSFAEVRVSVPMHPSVSEVIMQFSGKKSNNHNLIVSLCRGGGDADRGEDMGM